MPKLATFLPHSERLRRLGPLIKRGYESPLLLRSDVLVGLEIESEGYEFSAVKQQALFPYWRPVADGSLRGEHPIEFVSVPMSGLTINSALDSYAYQTREAPETLFSWRCATHVHIDLLRMEMEHIANLIPLTIMTDNFFYSQDESRRANYNCRPLSVLNGEIEALAGFAHQLRTNPEDIDMEQREDARYMGINWTAFRKQSTLEFRHFPGSNDPVKIRQWINLVFSLVTAAEKHDLNDLGELFLNDLDAFGEVVFGDEAWATLAYKATATNPDCYDDWEEAKSAYALYCDRLTHLSHATSLDALLRSSYVLTGELV